MSFISSQKKNIAKMSIVLLSLLFCVSAIFFFVMLYKSANRSESELLGSVSKRIAQQISESLQEMLTVGEGLRELIIAGSGRNYASLGPLADEALARLPYIDSITIAPGAIVRYFFPESRASASIGHDLLDNPDRMRALVEAVRKKSAVLQGPELSAEGKNLAFLRIPVIEGSELWGFVSIAFDADKLLSDLDLVSQFPGLSIAVASSDMEKGDKELFWGEERALSGYSAGLKIGSEDFSWTIYVASLYPYRQVALWGAGLLILVLLSCGLAILAGSLEKEGKAPIGSKEALITIKPFVPKIEPLQESSIGVIKKAEILQEPMAENLVSASLGRPIKETVEGPAQEKIILRDQEIEKEAENKESAAPKEKIASARSVLVVDDSEVNRDLLLRMLTLKGYEARAVSSAEAALESLRVKSFDIMLIDCVMPEMDGYALAQKIRAEDISQQKGLQSALPRPVLIAMSPRHDQEEAEKCAKAGFDSLLVKPFTMTALDQQIRLIFDDKRIG